MIKKLISVIFLFFLTIVLLAQPLEDWEHRIITPKEGLPDKDFITIFKDSRGFMWFGNAASGLYRYDGYTFKNINFQRSDTFNFQSNNFVTSIIEDKDNILWIGGINGLFKLDPKESEHTLNRYLFYTESMSIWGFHFVYKILEDHNGYLWLGTVYGSRVPVFNKETGTYKFIELDPKLPDTPENQYMDIYNLIQDVNNDIWFATLKGLYKYNYETEDINVYRFNNENINDSINNIINLCENDNKSIWIVTMHGLYLFNKQLEKFTQPFTGNIPVLKNRVLTIGAIKKDNTGKLWFRILNDLYQIEAYKNKYKIERKITIPLVYPYPFGVTKSLFFDECNNIWFTSLGEGIHVLKPKQNDFKIILYNYNLRYNNSLFGFPRSVYEDSEGILWIGYVGSMGISKFNPKTGIFTHYLNDPQDKNNFCGKTIISIYQDKTGTIWFGSLGDGLFKMIINPAKHILFKRYRHNPEDSASLKGDWIFRIFEDEEDNLWFDIGDFNLEKYDRERDAFIHLNLKTNFINNAPYESEKIKGEIWLPNFEGIHRIIPPFTQTSEHSIKANKIIWYKYDRNDPYSMKNCGMTNSYWISRYYKPGTLWFGTEEGLGKITMNREEQKNDRFPQFSYLTKEDGLSGNSINGIIEDHQGNIWVGTNEGLSRYDPRNQLFSNYYFYDNLRTNEFIGYQPHINKEGKIYFVNAEGIVIFYPDSIQNEKNISNLYITDFKLFNKSVPVGENSPLKNTIGYTKEIELKYHQNNIAFEYVVLDYNDPSRNQYRYKLEGFDKDWINAGNDRMANYTNVKPGTYVFKVQGSNSKGVWNLKGASLKINISPPPWLMWWAYLIYGFILIGIILWYRRFLLNRAQIRTALEVEKMEKEKVQELDHMKTRFFANISHEFRTPLTLLLGPVEDLLKSRSDRDEKERGLFKMMQRNIKRLQMLINQLLDLSKLETGKIKLQVSEGNLSEFIRRIVLSFLSLAESKHIDYQYDIPELSEPVYFDADKVEKILTNLISNAFKFTPDKGKISVRFSYILSDKSELPQFAEITVSDTGKGIPEKNLEKIFDRFYRVSDSNTRDAEGSGVGLALTKELVDLYRGEIHVESEIDNGSIFRVKLPISKEQFKEEEIVAITFNEEVSKSQKIKEESELTEIEESQYQEKTTALPLILIVEDNIDLRNYISGNLCNHYQIITAENGKQGLELAIESIPDLVVSDLMMPVMDGIEMCKQLKTDERTNHIPLVMLTARADRESKIEGLETGADDYIIKPFDAEELQVRVKNLIEQRNKLREKFRKEFFIPDKMEISFTQNDLFIQKLFKLFEENYSDFDFSVEDMGRKLHMSRTHFFRKVNAITGESPNELLRVYRMKKAAALIHSGNNNITGIMYEVGFRSTSHFATSFKKFYGQNPSEYRNSIHRS